MTKQKYLDTRCTAVYWYFVVITWLPFYFIVYIVPWMQRKGPPG
jgi:heme/copper-type cytochrome/quinol oxidase subunit 3